MVQVNLVVKELQSDRYDVGQAQWIEQVLGNLKAMNNS